MKAKTTRRALLMSALSLLLCVSMLVGTTFAWFTDSVTSGRNTIQAGNLDIVLEYWDGDSYEEVTSTTKLFDDAALWEPGYTEVAYLKVGNAGSLALKYQFAVSVYNETLGKTKTGADIRLSDHLQFKVVESDEDLAGTYASREAAQNANAIATKLQAYNSEVKALDAKNDAGDNNYYDYVALIIYMPETVGNEANHDGVNVPSIEMGVNLFATQQTAESDSFNNQYDKDATFDDLGGVPTLEQLQAKYKFEYYSTLNDAIDAVNNGTTGTNSGVNNENAVAGVYTDENGNNCIVLLKDCDSASPIIAQKDMIFNLGGHALTFDLSSATTKYGVSTASATPANLTIDGRLPGSKIEAFRSDGQTARAVQFFSGNCTILGGTYISHTEGNMGNACIQIGGSAVVTISDARVIATETTGDSRGIVINEGTTATINNCYVTATHSAVSSYGTLTVDGGTYESAGHGGFYFGGRDVPTYVKNAIIRESEMMDGYTNTGEGVNHAGFYIGGSTGKTRINVCLDNCDIYGSKYPFVMRGSSGETNNNIYISNSRINTDATIRIDNDTLKIYLGAGNNFTADNTNRPTSVISTGETYIQK